MNRKKTNVIVLTLLIIPIIYTINNGKTQNNTTEDWQAINNWGYQLQNIELKVIKESTFDLVVIDYSADGTNETAWNKQEIQSITSSGKIVLCYLSIGEAEDYRFYWNDDWNSNPPTWLDEENPDWEGNYKVKFWMEGWQSIVYQYLDIVMKQGFNGVYLDIIDAYEYYEEQGMTNARELMVDFVYNISIYARTKKGDDFGIFPQNGEELLESKEYREIITGIGIEDLYFMDDNEKNSEEEITRRESKLDLLTQENKTVLTVDYVQKEENIAEVIARAREKGYIPYCTARELDTLTPPPQISESSYTALFTNMTVLTAIMVISIKKKNREKEN